MRSHSPFVYSAAAQHLAAATWQCPADVALFEYGLSIDNVITGTPDPLPPGSSLNTVTGLGGVVVTVDGTGLHTICFFVDHELSEEDNTFFNELGEAVGAPPAGLSWEIDEPGFSDEPGDIFDNFSAGTLDNSVGKVDPDDVSMALCWEFDLADGEEGTVNFRLSETAPAGFYLVHSDPESDEAIYFSASLLIQPGGGGGVVPEGDGRLAGGALAALAFSAGAFRRFRAGRRVA